MKKEKRIFLVIGVSLVLVLTIAHIVYALSWKFNVKADKTRVKAGEEIAVGMQISEINMGDLGINAIEAILDYDDTVFETVEREDFEMENNWTMTYNQEAGNREGNFLISNIVSGIKQTQKLGEIKFKIREDAKPGTTVIKFKNVKSNDGRNLVSESNKEIEITVYEEEKTDGKAKPVKPSEITPKGSIDDEPEKLPQTGDNVVIILGAMLLIITSVVLIIKYKNIHID